MPVIDDILDGFQIMADPFGEDMKLALTPLREYLTKLDVETLVKVGMLVHQIHRMVTVKKSLSAKVRRIVDTVQPSGHPLSSVAYAAGHVIDADKTKVVSAVARHAKGYVDRSTPKPPTNDELNEKLVELAKFGIDLMIVEKKTQPVDANPGRA